MLDGKTLQNHAVVVADKSGVIHMWSAGAQGLFGYSAEQALGKKLDLVVPEEYRAQHWAGFNRAMETGAADMAGQPFDLPILCSNGELRVFKGLFVLLRDAQAATIGAMAIFNRAPDNAV